MIFNKNPVSPFEKISPSPLRLTSHVFVLSVLIVVTLATAIIAGLQTFVMPCVLPLALMALALPIIDLLNAVSDTRRRLNTQSAHALQPLVSRLCDELHIHPHTRIEATNEAIALHTIGSARHSLIVGRAALLDRLAADSANPASNKRLLVEAILYHELQHVAQKDVCWLAWTRSSLLTVTVAAGWVFMLACGLLVALQTLAVPFFSRLLQPATLAQLAQAAGLPATSFDMLFPRDQIQSALAASREITYGWLYLGVIDTLLPFAIASAVLATVVWARMARVRELYADAAVAERYGPVVARSSLNYLRTLSAYGVARDKKRASRLRLSNLRRYLPRFHPSPAERAAALVDFAEVLTRPLPNGAAIGAVALLLSFLSSGAASVLLFGAQPALLPLLVVFLATSILMTPAAITLPGTTAFRRVILCAGVALAIGSLYALLNTALALLLAALQPAGLLSAADLIVRIVYGLRQPVAQPEDVLRLATAALGLLITMIIGSGMVMALACADVWLKRRLAQASIDSRRLSRRVLLSTLGMGACLALALAALAEIAKALST